MKFFIKIMLIACVGLVLLLAAAKQPAEAVNLLPRGLIVQDGFKPGSGAVLGKVVRVIGKAVLIHKGEKVGYTARPGIHLFKNDTIVTLEGSHLSFTLNDGSFMSLSQETRITITKSIYAPEKKKRVSLLDMALGKARFLVQKFVDAKHSEFKVKTSTSVAGVRGSDFIIIASADETEITTLSDTVLEVISLSAPDEVPAVMHSFEQALIKEGMRRAIIRKIGARDVERLLKEFLLKPRAGHKEGKAIRFEPAKEGKKSVAPPAVSEKDLVSPGYAERRLFNSARTPATVIHGSQEAKHKIKDRIKDREVLKQRSENMIKTDVVHLPDFPGVPNEGENGLTAP